MPTKNAIQRVPDLRSQVYANLRDAIRRGAYPRDFKFQEHSIARDFGVSRTPAREALALLACDGLLVQEGRGFRYPVYTAAEIKDVFEVRQRLEPYAITQVAKHASDSDLVALGRLAEREFSLHGRSEKYIEANARLREAVFSLCPNQRLTQLIRLHEEQIAFVRYATLASPEFRQLSVEVFSKVIQAVIDRDTKGAKRAMEILLKTAHETIVSVLLEKEHTGAQKSRKRNSEGLI
jgi:DNA-binding GntR family transcriptional regulator